MSDYAPNALQVVGVPRHTFSHYGRWVTEEQRVYVLHSQECLDCGRDLLDCRFSVALDQGVDPLWWMGFKDVLVLLGIVDERLVPLKELGVGCDGTPS